MITVDIFNVTVTDQIILFIKWCREKQAYLPKFYFLRKYGSGMSFIGARNSKLGTLCNVLLPPPPP